MSKEESDKFRNDPVLRKRILKSRFVITKGDEGPLGPHTELKARWCIRGYLDPDLMEISQEAPTLSSEGGALALQLISSFGWKVQICDIEGAFLQGEGMDRQNGVILIEQPPGGIEGMEPNALMVCLKTVYGLADAPLPGMSLSRVPCCP